MVDVRLTAPGPRRLAILDDHILVLDGLTKWVQVNAADFDVVVAAGSWAELVEGLPRHPEVVIMAQDVDGPTLVDARIRACVVAGAKVVIMSTLDTAEARKESLDAGAMVFISKARSAAEVVTAARWALGSDTPCDSDIGGLEPDSSAEKPRISEAEIAILKHYSNGFSTVEIALIQEIKFEAVRSTLKRIREAYKTQGREAATRDQLLQRAAEDGYFA